VLTGDVTYKYKDPTFKHIKDLARIFAEAKTHWAVVLGNHDEDCGFTRNYISKVYRSLPYNCNAVTPGIRGATNFVLPIAGIKSKKEAILYFFDSNAYNDEQHKNLGRFDWIDFTQLEWYRKISAAFTKKNGGKPIPSIAFFHIPLLEYEMVWADSTSTSIGVNNEKASTPLYNTGLFALMLQCGDIMGTFVGHEHNNNYIGCYNGIALAYGQYTGPINYGVLKPGARVIVLKEGKREFTTWIREKGGKIKYKCHYPNSFLQNAE
jgi:3',5'-cyclic AMP phosphodiesterase CpdA